MEINLLHPESFEKRELLDWTVFLEKAKSFSFFEENKVFFNSPSIFYNSSNLEKHFSQLNQMMAFLLENKAPLFPHSFQLQNISKIRKVTYLSLEEIHHIALLVESAYPLLKKSVLAKITREKFHKESSGFEKLIRKIDFIRRYISLKGELITEREPRIHALSEKIKEHKYTIRNKLQNIARSQEIAPHLQNTGFDYMDGHFVLTMRTNSYRSSMGAIIGESKTGASLYVEPDAIKSERLKLDLWERELKVLISQLCQKLSSKILEHREDITSLYKISLYLDRIQVFSQVNLFYELCPPQISRGSSRKLLGFFHPLISNPVKNNLTQEKDHRGGLISGPNTGGKTICLKVLALSQLLMQSGFFVPAEQASLPIVQSLYFVAGDQQTIQQGLSSFSAEVTQYLSILQGKKDPSLILIDEIFNSTSSEEASALALSFMEEFLINSSTTVFLSSHHSLLKNTIFENKALISFHMGFEKKTNTPTYKLIEGTPGGSMAIEIFDSLAQGSDFHSSIKSNALKNLSQLHSKYESLLAKLGRKTEELEGIKRKLKKSQLLFNEERKSYRKALDLKNKRELDELKERLIKIEQGEYGKRSKEIKELKEKLSPKSSKVAKPTKKLKRPKAILIGQNYFSQSLQKTICILKVQKEQVHAQMGNMKIHLKKDDLYEIPLISSRRKKPKVHIEIEANHQYYETEKDFRGLRLEDFEQEFHRALQGLLLKKIPYLKIIHGHGDGILKKYLRNYLKKSPEFQSQICPESADGATIIQLSP